MLDSILEFLGCQTPEPWIQEALKKQDQLLIDHANCEKKAAATAMNLMYRHTLRPELLTKMSQLAREELLHFQQVVEIMSARKIRYVRLGPSRYAAGLRALFAGDEKQLLIDVLITGAFIEARSCERFACLAPQLDEELNRFYKSLLKSEARHFQDYLDLAERYAEKDISGRVAEFRERENELIKSPDNNFRFHSGIPVSN
ncbi:MAG: tRNA-(ms[2]io[6]A)-hydroxylase [Gammaproteobacteria bacterium]|nr:tRNA-(ms[2]io[6]A)-hydroxylase [Gammaproteobacteria bacterium]MDD9959628.1 tRNA-(ms[2]io[6]A)-hydroxylase [Gammaproteobacteria bacterium]